MDTKAPEAFRTISEVAGDLEVPQHVLRFWETRFREIHPMKRGGGRRYYRPDDVNLLRGIRYLLYGQGYTIRGVQRILQEEGPKFVQLVWQEGAPQPPHGHPDADAHETDAPDAVQDDTEDEETVSARPRLREKLASLIGRDLDDEPEVARPDPPMRSAPMPRIAPQDRVLPVPETRPVEQASRHEAPQEDVRRNVSREDLRRLQSALHELAECKKLLSAARDPVA